MNRVQIGTWSKIVDKVVTKEKTQVNWLSINCNHLQLMQLLLQNEPLNKSWSIKKVQMKQIN